jgi:hypothetical protein
MGFEEISNEELKIQNIITNLYKWMREKNYDIKTNSLLELINSPNPFEGRCVIASENIKHDQIIAEMPISLLINYRFVFEKFELKSFCEWSCEQKQPINRLDALYLFLIDELIDSNSNYHSFVVSMPQTYDSPEYFEDSVVDCLPNYLRTIVSKRRDLLSKKFQHLKELLIQFNTHTKTLKSLSENFSFELFRWAFCSVNTRCFHFDEENVDDLDLQYVNKLFGSLNRNLDKNTHKDQVYEVNNSLCCLIPCLDFMNHSHNSNAYGEFNQETKTFTLTAIEKRDDNESEYAIKKDEQIYVQYGSHDNRTLFIEYGFILMENCYDYFEFDRDDFNCLLNIKTKEDDLLTLINVNKINISDLNCNNDGPSWSVLKTLDFVCYLNETSNEKDSKKAKKLKQNDTSSINHIREIKLLYEKVLVNYKNQLEEATNKFSSKDVGSNYHLTLSRNLCKLQLEIIEKNLILVSSNEAWLLLF